MSASILIACVLIVQLCGYLSEACTQMNMKEAAIGYRCEDGEVASHNISLIPQRECTMLCLQRPDCVQVNYNYVNNYCLLFSSFCTLAQSDEEFTMLRYVDDVVSRGQCIRWVEFPGTLPTGGIVINGPNQLLARGNIDDAVIPGKLYTRNLKLYSAYNGGSRRITNNIEYLDIHPSCFVVWVPHISGLGMDLPDGAVQGGWLSDGTPLYVARAMGIRFTHMGYYDSNMDKAIVIDGTQLIHNEMDILVLI